MSQQPADHHHNREPGWPAWGRQNLTLTAALRMVRMYGDRIPSVAQLRAAFRDAIEQNEAAHAG
ncbi:hypothetical protein ACS0OQ_13595 [Stenotrophomonas riyadhensis]|uniref:hypothetical protein n=1 Tax=Stenotrophomonas riyadhensis TaxID=2859893 RepID=UPI003F9CBA9A